MRHPANIYAKAFADVLEKTSEKDHKQIVKRFAGIVAKNGDLGNFEKIQREIQKILVKKNRGKYIEVEFARKNDVLRDKLTSVFSNMDHIEVSIKEELLAGSRILIDHEKELDFSFQKKLRQLFS